jgi:GH18 family chitinase
MNAIHTLLKRSVLAATLFGTMLHAQRTATPQPPAFTIHDHAPYVVAYLPYYKGEDMTAALQAMNWSGITHLDVAFVNPPKCSTVCTKESDMSFASKRHTEDEMDIIVRIAHQHHVKVLYSIGGGGGDQMILQFYNAGLSEPLIDSLDKYVKKHHVDGVDVDIEAPDAMGAPFATFVDLLVKKLRPQGKLITAAVAKYMQGSMPDRALHQFDYINIMVYSGLQAATDALTYYEVNKKVPRNQIVLGVPFFGNSHNESKYADYSDIVAGYPNAYRVDTVSGGLLVDGVGLNYVGEDTMAKEVALGKQYGGVMIWEILGDAPAPHSLMDVIRKNLQ